MSPRPSVLLVSYHFLPAATPGSRRLDEVARRLSARGWESLVVTATPARAGQPEPADYTVVRTTPALSNATAGPAIASPRVARVPLLRSLAGFPDKYAPWGVSLVPSLLSLLRSRPIDVVYSSSPPHSLHLAVANARALKRFPWVAEFRDPWMFPSRRAPGVLSASVQRALERRVLARADRIVVNTPGNLASLLAANPRLDPARVRVSTNGYDERLFAADAVAAGPTDSADITYVGEIYEGMLAQYARAVASIRDRSPSHTPRLAVYGTIHPAERARMQSMGLLPYLDDRGFVSHEESITAMQRARALLALLPQEERWRTCVPSKVYWYLAARRPILAFVPDGDTAVLVRTLQAGRVFGGDDAAETGRELETFIMKARAADAPLLSGAGTERFSMNAIVDDLDALLREVLRGNSA